MFVFWLPISFESAAQVSRTVSQNEIQISLTAPVCGWIVTRTAKGGR